MLPIDEILDTEPRPVGRSIGRSREGRDIRAIAAGTGPVAVSCIAGCHADEPVGPAMLDRFATWLARAHSDHPALRDARWALVPHVNPDGDARNRAWAEATIELSRPSGGGADRGFRLDRYVAEAIRELPGDDVEFGFPRSEDDGGARPENRAVAGFLAATGPFDLHVSFHGMGFAHGPWFLLEPFWVERTRDLRRRLAEAVEELGYRLHDVDRGGEKGFWRIDAGFTTRPDSRSMRDYFLSIDDAATAARFRPSSMEYVRSLGGDPLTMVSEMPLFLLPDEGPLADPALPRLNRLELLRRALADHGPDAADALRVRPMPIRDQMRLQLELLDQGLEALLRHPRSDAP